MEFNNRLERINEIYQLNIVEIEKELLNIGINLRKNEKEYKTLPEVLQEIANIWETLSREDNKFIKEWICQSIAGIRDSNFLKLIIEKLL